MKWRPAQRAARRPLLPPRAHGLDDAPPAAAGVAARPQLAVGRARQAHSARVPPAVGAAGAATDGGVAAAAFVGAVPTCVFDAVVPPCVFGAVVRARPFAVPAFITLFACPRARFCAYGTRISRMRVGRERWSGLRSMFVLCATCAGCPADLGSAAGIGFRGRKQLDYHMPFGIFRDDLKGSL